MKKQFLNLSAIAAIAIAVVFTGCKKDDVDAPVVTLTGAASITISLNSTYTELGATATDERDGALTPTVTGAVNKDLTGTYTLTYSATDAAGNTGTATRTVIVKNDLDAMTGTYTCVVTGISPPAAAYTYTQTITASTTLNNRIKFGKFGDYSGNTGIYADIVATTVTLPSQTAVQVGSPATDRTFSGTGTKTSTGLSLSYTETTSGGSGTFTETFTKN